MCIKVASVDRCNQLGQHFKQHIAPYGYCICRDRLDDGNSLPPPPLVALAARLIAGS